MFVVLVVGVQHRRTNARRRETHFTNFETKTFRYLLRCRDQVNLDKNVMDRIESGEEKNWEKENTNARAKTENTLRKTRCITMYLPRRRDDMQDVFSKSITLQLSTLNRFLFSSSVRETKQTENEKSDSQHQERSKREMKEAKKKKMTIRMSSRRCSMLCEWPCLRLACWTTLYFICFFSSSSLFLNQTKLDDPNHVLVQLRSQHTSRDLHYFLVVATAHSYRQFRMRRVKERMKKTSRNGNGCRLCVSCWVREAAILLRVCMFWMGRTSSRTTVSQLNWQMNDRVWRRFVSKWHKRSGRTTLTCTKKEWDAKN